jgi:outer membrane protein assembly factor BamB
MWAFGYNTDRLYYIRGTATAALYKFTIITSAWSADTTYGYKFETFTTGTVVAYDSLNRIYIVKDATHRIYYYQLDEDKLYVGGMFPYVSGTGIVGDGFVYIKTLDGAEYLCYRRHTGTEFWRMLIGWF